MENTLTREDVTKKTIDLVQTYVPELKDKSLKEDSIINKDMSFDSMGFMYVMIKIESEFNIKVPQKKWDKMKTLKDVVDSVMEELKKKK